MISTVNIDPNAGIRPNQLQGGGMGLLNQPASLGTRYYVDSSHAASSDSVPGTDPTVPWDTLAYGVTQAASGDVIIVGSGHTETLAGADALPFAAAGVYVFGCGWGGIRPTFTFATSTAAQILLDTASTVLRNLLFINTIDDIVMPIKIDAADCALLDIEYREDSGDEGIDIIGSTANADRLLIDGIKIIGDTGGNSGQSAINIVGGTDVTVRNFNIYGDFQTGNIENVTTAAVRLTIEKGLLWCVAPEDIAIGCKAETTGTINGPIKIKLADHAANFTGALVGAAMQFFGDFLICNLVGEQGGPWDGTTSTSA
ncbi:MAG: hypothetical protein ACYTG0_29250 [Planctomycetota bacterium]|jgi:hypothetical protein